MSNVIVGKRLAQLRSELAGPGEEMWSQGKVASETGLTTNMVGRLEQFCGGSIDAILALLAFYHGRGYNVGWIILPDNSAVSKYVLSDSGKAIDTQFVIGKIGELQDYFGEKVADLVETLSA
ncbi:MAG: hypothetical protein ACRYG7_06505 [Janthinobacterium lividum]